MEINKTTPISFTSYKSVFSKKLERSLATERTSLKRACELISDFSDMYDKKICSSSKIGSGFYGTVYKIDDCYVLKRGNECLEPEFCGIKLIRKGQFTHLKHYFGEAVAKIYNKRGEDMLILKNVYSKGKSIAAGICEEFTKKHTREQRIKYYNEVYLPKFSSLPQRSFDGIALDFAKLNKMCTKQKSYTFDYINPNNFVLCGKTLRIIDNINIDENQTRNCATDMLEVFLNKMDLDTDTVYEEKLVDLRAKLAKKIILACVRHNVPMIQSYTDLNCWGKTFNNLLGMNLSGSMMEDFIKNIDDIMKEDKNPKHRVELVKQYLETTIGI